MRTGTFIACAAVCGRVGAMARSRTRQRTVIPHQLAIMGKLASSVAAAAQARRAKMCAHLQTKLLGVLVSAAMVGFSGDGVAQGTVVHETVPIAASQVLLLSDTDFARGRSPAVDVSAYNMVRVNIVVENCDPCSNIAVRVEGHGKVVDYYLLDAFTISNSASGKGNATKVYDIPGLSMNVAIANLRTGSRNWVRVEMLGHSN